MNTKCARRTVAMLVLFIVMGAGAGAQDRDIVPVTDAMLQNPDPADWLNWRRTLDGWGYSPLDHQTKCLGYHGPGSNSSGLPS